MRLVKALGLLGLGAVTIVDPDFVEPSNLTRSILLRNAPPGAAKAPALAAAAAALFPDTRFSALATEIADVGFGLVSSAHLIFGCVDSELARLEIAYVSTKLDLPVCDAGLGAAGCSHGRVSYFPGRAAACYGCTLSRRKRAELLTFWDATVRPCAAPPGAPPNTAAPTISALTGALQADTGFAFSWNTPPPPRPSSSPSTLLPASTLSACPSAPPALSTRRPRTRSSPPATVAVPCADSFRIPAPRPVLRCSSTGPSASLPAAAPAAHRWAPLLRLARFRRYGLCPSCSSRDILELATIRAIAPGSPWSDLSLLDLGVPETPAHRPRARIMKPRTLAILGLVLLQLFVGLES